MIINSQFFENQIKNPNHKIRILFYLSLMLIINNLHQNFKFGCWFWQNDSISIKNENYKAILTKSLFIIPFWSIAFTVKLNLSAPFW